MDFPEPEVPLIHSADRPVSWARLMDEIEPYVLAFRRRHGRRGEVGGSEPVDERFVLD